MMLYLTAYIVKGVIVMEQNGAVPGLEMPSQTSTAHQAAVSLVIQKMLQSQPFSVPITVRSSTETEETELILVFFCPSNALEGLQSLVKETDIRIQVLSTLTSSGSVRATIKGSLTHCCEVLSEYLKQQQQQFHNLVHTLVTIENRLQWIRVVGKNGCVNKAIKNLSGAEVTVDNSKDFPMNCHVIGLPEQVKMAEELLKRTIEGGNVEATPHNILPRIKNELVELCGFQFESVT